MNKHIESLILKADWESVDFAIQEKEAFLKQILLFEKPRIEDIKKNKELNETRLHLIELEKENILLVKKLRIGVIRELSGVKKSKKVLNTYEPTTNNIISTFEINNED